MRVANGSLIESPAIRIGIRFPCCRYDQVEVAWINSRQLCMGGYTLFYMREDKDEFCEFKWDT